MKNFRPLAVTASMCLLFSASASAETVRQHGKHEHGAAELLVAFEDGQLQVALETPAFNLVGFGLAKTEEQQHQAAEVRELLGQPQRLFALDGLGCVPTSTQIEGAVFESSMHHEDGDDDHDEDHDEEHDGDHDKDHDADHDGDHDEEHDADHEEDHDADHDDDHDADHDHESSHSDVDVEWTMRCEGVDSLQQLEVNLFQHFEHLQALDVQYVMGNQQGAQQLSAEQSVLRF